jgi:hypothetical protein
MGESPEPPSVVSRIVQAPKDLKTRNIPQTVGPAFCFRAPLRLFSTRAPRQAVLRASFRLAPCSFTKACTFTTDKMLDASDRLLPSVRFACTRTRAFPARYRSFHCVGASWNLIVPRDLTGGPGGSRRLKDRFGGPHHLLAGVFCASGGMNDRASDTPVASPSFPPHGALLRATFGEEEGAAEELVTRDS